MITEAQMKSAVVAGVLTEETAEALRLHVAQSQSNISDEENFRLITGFNDIFVVIASLLLMVSVKWMGGDVFGNFLAAAAAWGLSEFFVRKRRMALPAIVLLLAFVTYVSQGALAISDIFTEVVRHRSSDYIIPAIAVALAAWLHWKRFKVPITLAAIATSIVASLFAIVMSNESTAPLFPYASALAGIAVFIYAMRWDAKDASRQTKASDTAFWLHILAAPLIVHPIFSMLGVFSGEIQLLQAFVVFVLYIAIAIISLLIDRRALMVSSLGYVIYVFASLFKDTGNIAFGLAITGFTIGLALLILSAYWHQCRSFVLGYAPDLLKKYIPN